MDYGSRYPDFTKEFILNIDASLKGLEAVLSQQGVMVNLKSLPMQAVIIALRKTYEKLPLHQIRTAGIEVGRNRKILR